ncbi:probable LRR receptor-like serine/threonine-protein kinase At3g47570 [Mercurialis annua]|uniref:probable LRR receptor-like serine/threonine-protein kinase At3g47570 n=1 Tax=Mercurialis annua TaxID=3986 RepID=UPI00215F89A1|nr:probable LRR receptor-like serine/threonine-protein kinase At3g47570 [Mercurialis annua]
MKKMLKIWHFIPIIILLTLNIVMATLSMAAVTNFSTDKSALVELKDHITLDPANVLTHNWSSSSSICDWIGISCTTRHQRVSALDLSNMGLRGKIPPHLGNLSFLNSLILSGNKFYGTLPNELSHLRRLKILSLDNNSFSGSIPAEMGNLRLLRTISLQYNNLSGPIPSSIFNMSSLEILALTSNGVSGNLPDEICHHFQTLEGLFLSLNELGGPIPSSLAECSNLKTLSLSFNGFVGSIPKEIGNLTTLNQLFLSSNHLSGTIPHELGRLINLEALGMSGNNLRGSIPATIFNLSIVRLFDVAENELSGNLPPIINLPNLEIISLANNTFIGEFPASISNSSKLIVLYLFNNSFSGFIPNTLGNLRMLQRLDISFNNFKADSTFFSSLTSCVNLHTLQVSVNPLDVVLPVSIGNMSSLQYFIAGSCKIKGDIPFQIGNLSTVVQMELSANELSGSIPSSFGRLRQLQGLSIAGNKLQGTIPVEICRLENLNYLWLNENELSGQIPECLPNLISLRKLYLQRNKLSFIPLSFWRLSFLLELKLSSNSLNGSLPIEIGNLKVLTSMDLSRNRISGAIPSSIGSLKDLQHLSLAENNFQGSIPQSFGDMVSLTFLNLSTNNLSGLIPKSLEKIPNLKSFDVSSNRLDGEIPSGGSFGNFSYESFKSNGALCGLPRFKVTPCEASRKSKATNNHLLKYILPPIAALSLIIAFIIIFIKIRKKKKDNPTNQESLLPLPTWKRFSFLQLAEATNKFSESNLLGKGSFGSVYKGSLSDSTNIAVKVFDLQVEGVLKSFDTECEVLRNIRHRNLVKVISSCSNLDFKALVLEFMPNGSLEKWLYSNNYFLNLQDRLNIMIDVASALEYLHSYETPIVHCDLKPSNILLDKDKVARVADFGIAKLVAGENCMTQTLTLATIGYMAPEYGEAGIVSTRGDVYSFGIMMMETFTRKKPTDDIFCGEMNMKQWVRNAYPDAVIEVVDRNLLGVEEVKHYSAKLNCVSSVLGLALDCCVDLPEERVNMKHILSVLERIKIQFLKHTSGV